MLADNLIKLRANIFFVLIILCYPAVLFCAALTKLYELLIGKPKCKSIAGQVALVTGGGHGLGKAISIELAKQNCQVAVVDINYENAEKVASFIAKNYNVDAKAYKTDVTNHDQVIELRDRVTADLGDVTILVNNAGIMLFTDLFNPSWQEVQRMINVNLVAHYLMNRTFLPRIKQLKRGHIVAISSITSFLPLIYNAEYTGTKFAVRGLMQVLRQELKIRKYDNIRTTTVFPSFLGTNSDVARLVKEFGTGKLYPLLTGDKVAERIVLGMLRNEEELVLPEIFALLCRFFEILPSSWQDAILLMHMKITDWPDKE